MAKKTDTLTTEDADFLELEDFIKKCGSAREAARLIAVDEATVSRWRNGHNRPWGLQAKRLHDLRVRIGPPRSMPKPGPNGLTYRQLVKACGTIYAAAARVGVSRDTFSAWMRGLAKPSPIAEARLRDMGVHT